MNRTMASVMAGLATVAMALPASAQVITTTAPGGATHINFNAFGPWYTATGGPVQVGGDVGQDVVFTSTIPWSVLGKGGYGLYQNGYWNEKSSAGLNANIGSMTFTFNDGPVSFVGGFINYARGENSTPFIEVLSTTNTILASYNLNIVTPDGFNAGQFYGFQSASNNIGSFRLSNTYVIMDDLTFERGANNNVTPEPISMTLLGTGLAGVAAARRKKKAAQV